MTELTLVALDVKPVVVYPKDGLAPASEAEIARIAPLGWHLQVHLDAQDILTYRAFLLGLDKKTGEVPWKKDRPIGPVLSDSVGGGSPASGPNAASVRRGRRLGGRGVEPRAERPRQQPAARQCYGDEECHGACVDVRDAQRRQ